MFPSGNPQPIDIKKLARFDTIVPLLITGKLTPDSVIAQGTAPHTVGFVERQDGVKFAKAPTEWLTMIPTFYNADTLGICPDLVAATPIGSADGTPIEKIGAVRDGGSFYERMSHFACWNAVMDENEYMVQNCNEFITA